MSLVHVLGSDSRFCAYIEVNYDMDVQEEFKLGQHFSIVDINSVYTASEKVPGFRELVRLRCWCARFWPEIGQLISVCRGGV